MTEDLKKTPLGTLVTLGTIATTAVVATLILEELNSKELFEQHIADHMGLGINGERK